jgi:8-amino-7-oxononanoate synthase
LICGDTEAHRELEDFIARWKQTEAALVFGSGYQANVGIISSLVNRADLIVSDELNHASIIDGCRLSGARVEVYPHADVSRLEDLLRLGGFRRKLVVTESVFSMDGDSAPIREIAMLCRKAGAMLMVDEAHASGVLGPQGRGLAAAEGVCPDIQMGTMGKAVGASGAYVAGPRPLIELLVNRARPLIYTTAQPPGVIGAALAGLKIISSEEGDRRRSRLAENGRLFPRLLTKAFGSSHRPGHIVPFLIGESARTMRISALCLAKGVFAHGIRRPTVPEGSARLRFTLMSDHTEEDIRRCALAVKQAVEQDRETAP